MKHSGHQITSKEKRELRCKIILDLIVRDYWVALIIPFSLPAQFINRQSLKRLAVSFLLQIRLVILSRIAGLLYFWDHARINPYNRAPRPSGSFTQDQPRSFLVVGVLNNLKTFCIGLVACASGIVARGSRPRVILVMVRMW